MPLMNRYGAWWTCAGQRLCIILVLKALIFVKVIFGCSFSLKDMSAALNERNKENRQDNLHSLHNLETSLNNDGETHTHTNNMHPKP